VKSPIDPKEYRGLQLLKRPVFDEDYLRSLSFKEQIEYRKDWIEQVREVDLEN
jgi:hypothetical protein